MVLASADGVVLLAALVIGLSEVVEPWLSALIIGIALLVIAAIVGLIGRKTATDALPPKPEQTMASVHEDLDYLKEQTSR